MASCFDLQDHLVEVHSCPWGYFSMTFLLCIPQILFLNNHEHLVSYIEEELAHTYVIYPGVSDKVFFFCRSLYF